MNTCIECGMETSGSIGAAGIKWTRICQTCKNDADTILAKDIALRAAAFDAAFKVMFPVRDAPFRDDADQSAILNDEPRSPQHGEAA